MKHVIFTGCDAFNTRTETICSIGLIIKSFNLSLEFFNVDTVAVDLTGRGKVVLADGFHSLGRLGTIERYLDLTLKENHLISKNKVTKTSFSPISDAHFGKELKEFMSSVTKLGIEDGVVLIDFNDECYDIMAKIDTENIFHVHAVDIFPEQTISENVINGNRAPDLIVAKYHSDLSQDRSGSLDKIKIASFGYKTDILQIPQILVDQNIDRLVQQQLQIDNDPSELIKTYSDYSNLLKEEGTPIAVVAEFSEIYKYLGVLDAFDHSICSLGHKVTINKIKASHFEEGGKNCESAWEKLKSCRGIMVAGGSGKKGSEGRATVAEYARLNNVPFLGICYGMQFCAIEFARNVCGLKFANTVEVEPDTSHPLFIRIKDSENNDGRNHGQQKIVITAKNSFTESVIGTKVVHDRNFNRFEFNKEYIGTLESAGMRFVGFSEERGSVEIIELPSHPFYIATQFHPEFNSRFAASSKFYTEFLRFVIENKF